MGKYFFFSRSEKDAQICIYHVSWQSNFGFCCELDEECAKELAGVPGVLSVQPDKNFESENKDYGGGNAGNPSDILNSSEADQTAPVKTKKLFATGLSFYTSEKTLRAAFEGFCNTCTTLLMYSPQLGRHLVEIEHRHDDYVLVLHTFSPRN